MIALARPHDNYDRHVAALQKLHRRGEGGFELRASAGIGHEVTKPSRQRRNFGLILGITASADRHLDNTTLSRLRELNRMHDRQTCLWSGILNRALDNIFGDNFHFIPDTGDDELDKKVGDYIASQMTASNADAEGVRGIITIGKDAIRAVWNDGDLVLVKRKDGKLLAFEADQIVTPHAGDRPAKTNIVLGIEKNKSGKPVAYWIRQRGSRGDYGAAKPGKFRRLRSAYAICPAYRTRFGQTRGVPFLSAALSLFDRFDAYLDNESFAAQLNATAGFKIIQKVQAEELMPGVNDNPEATSDSFEKVQEFEPGWVFQGMPGEDVSMVGADRPGDQFAIYIKTVLRIIGVAVGYPLELLTLDFKESSFSGGRMALGEARRAFKGWQKFSGEQIMSPWYRWKIARAIADESLPANPGLFRHRCSWPRWEYIEPKKDAEADLIAITTTTKSPQQCIRDRGGNPEEVLKEIGEWKDDLKKLGLGYPKPKNTAADGKGDNSDEENNDE